MPTWLKVLLILLLVLVLVVCGFVFIIFRWVKSHEGELKASGEKVRAEARMFGEGKTPEACVDETFARLDRCDGLICEAMTKVFLTHCVAASNVPQGYCDTIPKRTEFIATAKWAISECASRGRGRDQRCTRILAGLQDYCEKR